MQSPQGSPLGRWRRCIRVCCPVRLQESCEEEVCLKEPAAVTAAKASSNGLIIVAVIGLIGTLILGYWQFVTKPSEANQPTPTQNTTSLAIEQIPFTLETYDGERDDPACCVGRAYFSLINNEKIFPEYLLRYTFPKSGSKWGYAGIEFIFSKSQNFSSYKNLEFTVVFDVEATKAAVRLEDISQTNQQILFTRSAQSENPIIIPLGNFNRIDSNAVHSISFEADTSFASGSDEIIIKDIRFSK